MGGFPGHISTFPHFRQFFIDLWSLRFFFKWPFHVGTGSAPPACLIFPGPFSMLNTPGKSLPPPPQAVWPNLAHPLQVAPGLFGWTGPPDPQPTPERGGVRRPPETPPLPPAAGGTRGGAAAAGGGRGPGGR